MTAFVTFSFHSSSLAPDASQGLLAEARGESRQSSPVLSKNISSEKDAISNTWVVGKALFTLDTLLDALKQERYHHIFVIGICQFADDIDVELVRKTVRRFRLIGKLVAPEDVHNLLLQMNSPE